VPSARRHDLYSVRSRRRIGGSPRTVVLSVQSSRAVVGRMAIDVMHQRDLFDRDALQNVDLYFKRSPWPEEVQKLPPELRGKVRPFGLNNPAISTGAAIRLLGSRMRSARSVRDFAVQARQLFALPSPEAFERSPDQPTEPLVLFQTRLWDSDEPQVLAINEQRVQLVRALRRVLGRHFIGGVIPTPFARRHHPDLLTPLPYSMRTYPRLVGRALVGVCSQGLHRSVASSSRNIWPQAAASWLTPSMRSCRRLSTRGVIISVLRIRRSARSCVIGC
jgi:hypothetical protein